MIIDVGPYGLAELVKDIPELAESLGGWDGYHLYIIDGKLYAIEE
ncbi:MAG: hypothetical protein ACFWUC_13855 [Oscillospiraceae bacterium]|jgi:hypothetical protein